jgi:hypothetical protein
LSLRAVEALKEEGAAVSSLSLRDLPHGLTELESQLGGPAIDDVMASGEVRPIRLLLVDGTESVLEGKGKVFRTVAAAALRAGFGLVAVTRTDGSRQVRDELARAIELAESGDTPTEHLVGPLTHDERQALPATFTALAGATGTLAPPADPAFWGAVAWVVVLSTLGGYGLYWANLARTSVARVSALLYLTPPTTLVWTWLMFGAPVGAGALTGMGVCVLAVWLVRSAAR